MKRILISLVIFGSASFMGYCQSSWVAPDSANTLENPLVGNEDVISSGKLLFEAICFVCHGNLGKGDGLNAANLERPPADLTSAVIQNQSDGALFWKISEGNPPMLSFKTSLSEEQRWQLVNYIRELTRLYPSNVAGQEGDESVPLIAATESDGQAQGNQTIKKRKDQVVSNQEITETKGDAALHSTSRQTISSTKPVNTVRQITVGKTSLYLQSIQEDNLILVIFGVVVVMFFTMLVIIYTVVILMKALRNQSDYQYRKPMLCLAILLTLTMVVNGQTTNWKIDPGHSRIQFIAKNLGIFEIPGDFQEFQGFLTTMDSDFVNSRIEFTADARSINTDNEKRDDHLRTDDFFHTNRYPLIKFVSRSFENVKANEYKLVGELTIRDVTKLVELEVIYLGTIIDGFNRTMAGFRISGKVNRQDFGINFNNTNSGGEAIVGDMVKIELNVQLEKQ